MSTMDAELGYLDLIMAPVPDMGNVCATAKTHKGMDQFWIYEFISYISDAKLKLYPTHVKLI